MKKIKDKLTAMLNAVTFAEAGEHETAIRYLDQHGQGAGSGSPSVAESHEAPRKDEQNLTELVQDHMVAAAFAEAGEFDMALSMLQTKKRPHSVLLLVQGETPLPEAFTHTVNLCKRLGANMQILAVSESVEGTLKETDFAPEQSHAAGIMALARAAEERGVSCSVFLSSGDLTRRLYRHVKQHKDVTTVVYGSPDTHSRNSRTTGVRRAMECIFERLSVPLVTVWSKNLAKANP